MKTVTIDHKNGHYTTYKEVNGMYFHIDTPIGVCNILNNYLHSNKRLKLYYGDVKTGVDWHEENGTIGTIGRSTGEVKIPLLIKSSRSFGGGAILDHCILKIKEVKTGYVLYCAENYVAPLVTITKSDMPEYAFNTEVNGQLFGRHRTERSAQRTKSILS